MECRKVIANSVVKFKLLKKLEKEKIQNLSLTICLHSLVSFLPDDTGMFYGIEYYNDMLLQSGEDGNVQTEMLLHKDSGIFTFRNGWAFPRKISFNGDTCVMPPPDDYPRLPNSGHFGAPSKWCIIFSLLLVIHF